MLQTRSGRAESQGLLSALVGDGRPLLVLVALGLILSGIFALFLSVTGALLPHDVAFLGMQPAELCRIDDCRIVHFIFHDRTAFGGTLIAIGILYLWLIAFPLRDGEDWAWWTLLLSGIVGFGSFFSYLIYGYFDTWHAVASAALLVLFISGMGRTRKLLAAELGGLNSLRRPCTPIDLRSQAGVGRACLLFVGAGMALAGLVIVTLGSTVVFVPQDLTFLGLNASQLSAIHPHLMPLIAHDRAGFGGGLASCGIAVILVVWKGQPALAQWQALLLAGLAGFGCAIGVHYPMGYVSGSHLAPAWTGAAIYVLGIICMMPAKPSAESPDILEN